MLKLQDKSKSTESVSEYALMWHYLVHFLVEVRILQLVRLKYLFVERMLVSFFLFSTCCILSLDHPMLKAYWTETHTHFECTCKHLLYLLRNRETIVSDRH